VLGLDKRARTRKTSGRFEIEPGAYIKFATMVTFGTFPPAFGQAAFDRICPEGDFRRNEVGLAFPILKKVRTSRPINLSRFGNNRVGRTPCIPVLVLC